MFRLIESSTKICFAKIKIFLQVASITLCKILSPTEDKLKDFLKLLKQYFAQFQKGKQQENYQTLIA